MNDINERIKKLFPPTYYNITDKEIEWIPNYKGLGDDQYHGDHPFISGHRESNFALLDGNFSLDELSALVEWMNKK